MNLSLLFGGSILAAFISGVIALLAPCCISVMLPAYFAGTFQNKRQIVGMTLIFALGIATVILPLVIGATYLVNLLNSQHTLIYVGGGLLMLGLGLFILQGGQLHIPMYGRSANNKSGIVGIYLLGVFSGVSSACCAPVLAGVITLSAFASEFSLVILLGTSYVMGMVIPLMIISLFWNKYDFKKSQIFKSRRFSYQIGTIRRTIQGTSLASGMLLTVIGVIAIQYGLTSDSMSQPQGWQYSVSITLQKVSKFLIDALSWVPNWITGLIVIAMILIALRKTFDQVSGSDEGEEIDE